MPFTGDTFAHLFDWALDPQRQEKIINARLEAEFDGVDTALTTVATDLSTLEAVTRREVLTAARTYYVRTDGSDSNTGLANTAGGAFLTIQKAIDTVASLDISIYDPIIQVGNGTYTGANTLKYPVGSGLPTIVGDESTPSNVVISTTSAACFEFSTSGAGAWFLKGMKLQTTTGGHGINNTNANATLFWRDLNFGSIVNDHIRLASGRAILSGNYTVSGGGDRHLHVREQGFCNIQTANSTITVSGTPAFGTCFAQCQGLGYILAGATTFSGSATGPRFLTQAGGIINTGGSGTSYFPGNSAGTEETVYDTYI